MSLRRKVFEAAITAVAFVERGSGSVKEGPGVGRIYVLRNNDIGDLLVITPLFEALKRLSPNVEVFAGVGKWNFSVLTGNPYVDQIVPTNAPWHNKQVSRSAPNSLRGLCGALRYIYRSPEVRHLRALRPEVGIDVLGSPYGSLLLMRAGIPYRLGVKGYAGGDTSAERCVEFDENEHVGRSALRFAEILGGDALPLNRPQIYMTDRELASGEERWRHASMSHGQQMRILVSSGGGFLEKCWPEENFAELTKQIASDGSYDTAIVGGKQDLRAGERLAAVHQSVRNWTGTLGLRETFAVAAKADFIICNSSMLMHVAAAFRKPHLVLLGASYHSARGHAAQWAYPALSTVVGPEADSGLGIASVDDAFSAFLNAARDRDVSGSRAFVKV